MPAPLDIRTFIQQASSGLPVIDVRTPKEFVQGHIPGAINMPLFSNEERAEVGTLYKQVGKQPAILRGLELVGPKMALMASEAHAIANGGPVLVHCWRGGMRSGSVAWLLEMYGLKVSTLKGGYKSFRQFALKSFAEPRQLLILGGKTGSGKTAILQQLSSLGEQVADLEALACHKGSAFGALGEKEPPSQEQFENELAMVLHRFDASQPTWMEDESRLIGRKVIPGDLWEQMRSAPLMYVQLPFEERVAYLVQEYGRFSKAELEASILKIARRLGPQHVKQALMSLEEGDLATVCTICLKYYDKSYGYGIAQREPSSVKQVDCAELDAAKIAGALINLLNNHDRH